MYVHTLGQGWYSLVAGIIALHVPESCLDVIGVLDVPHPIQLPICVWEDWSMGAAGNIQGLVTLYPHGKTGGVSWLPISDHLSSGHCGHLQGRSAEDHSITPLLCGSDFVIKINPKK